MYIVFGMTGDHTGARPVHSKRTQPVLSGALPVSDDDAAILVVGAVSCQGVRQIAQVGAIRDHIPDTAGGIAESLRGASRDRKDVNAGPVVGCGIGAATDTRNLDGAVGRDVLRDDDVGVCTAEAEDPSDTGALRWFRPRDRLSGYLQIEFLERDSRVRLIEVQVRSNGPVS